MHMITPYDRGYFTQIHQPGDLWHGRPEFILVGDRYVSMEEASHVCDVPLQKVQLSATIAGIPTPVDAFAIYRTDLNKVLVPAVGRLFHAEPYMNMLQRINVAILQPLELSIAGIGTLEMGRTLFIQIPIKSYRIGEDASEHVCYLTYAGKLGETRHKFMLVETRIVCDNTRRMAIAEAQMKGMLSSFKHTVNASENIALGLRSLHALYGAIEKDAAHLQQLQMFLYDREYLSRFLDKFIGVVPTGPDSIDRVTKHREKFMELLRAGDPAIHHRLMDTRYWIFQTYTNWLDRHAPTRNVEKEDIEIDGFYDGFAGESADLKSQLFNWLLQP